MASRSKLNELLKNAYTEVPSTSDSVPEHLLQPQVDVLILHCDADTKEANKLKYILTNMLRLDDGQPPSVGMIQQGSQCASSPLMALSDLHRAIDSATFLFLFLTNTFTNDTWAVLQKDECIMEALHNEEKWGCVVPVHTHTRWRAHYTTPFGLRCLKGLDLQMMLKGQTMDQLNVEELKLAQVDKYFLRNTTEMLNSKLRLRLQRQKKQESDLEQWFIRRDIQQAAIAARQSQRNTKNIDQPEEENRTMRTQQEWSSKAQESTSPGSVTSGTTDSDRSRRTSLVPLTFTATFWHRLVIWFIHDFRTNAYITK